MWGNSSAWEGQGAGLTEASVLALIAEHVALPDPHTVYQLESGLEAAVAALAATPIRSALTSDFPINSATFVEIFDTTRNLEASSYYSFRGEVGIVSGSTIDGLLNFLIPSGASISWSTSYQFDGITPLAVGATVGATPTVNVNCIELSGAAGERIAKFSGKIFTGVTSGKVSLLMAGKNSSTCTIKAASYMHFEKMLAT